MSWKTALASPWFTLAVIGVGLPGSVGSIQQWPEFLRSILSFSVLGMNAIATVSIIVLTAHVTSVAWNNGEPYLGWWNSGLATFRRSSNRRRSAVEPHRWFQVVSPFKRQLFLQVEPVDIDAIKHLRITFRHDHDVFPFTSEVVFTKLNEIKPRKRTDHEAVFVYPGRLFCSFSISGESRAVVVAKFLPPKEDESEATHFELRFHLVDELMRGRVVDGVTVINPGGPFKHGDGSTSGGVLEVDWV